MMKYDKEVLLNKAMDAGSLNHDRAKLALIWI